MNDNLNDNLSFRTIRSHELPALLELYRHLHAADAPLPPDAVLHSLWDEILGNPRLHYFVAELAGDIVASCTLAIIPNLTRGARPYGIIENVVTHSQHRGKGIGTQMLQFALRRAWEEDCYKVMLLTGSKREETLRFYERAGFKRGDKTGFVAWAAK
jgi:GNAT superfamily N-acetyltransferase